MEDGAIARQTGLHLRASRNLKRLPSKMLEARSQERGQSSNAKGLHEQRETQLQKEDGSDVTWPCTDERTSPPEEMPGNSRGLHLLPAMGAKSEGSDDDLALHEMHQPPQKARQQHVAASSSGTESNEGEGSDV